MSRRFWTVVLSDQPRLTRYWKYLKKIKKNGQGKLLSTQLEPIDEESHARKFVESYEVD